MLGLVTAVVAFGGAVASGVVINDTKFMFNFGDSYTTDGWWGNTNPLLGYDEGCAAAGPNWAIQLAGLWPQEKPRYFNLAVGGATADDSVVKSDVIDLITEVDAFDKYVQTNESTPWTSENALFTVSIGTNDIYLSFVDLDDLTGAELHKRTLDSYFFTVERLYQTGARAFVFNGLLPFDRAQFGISQGAELQAKLKAHIEDYSTQLEAQVKTFCASKSDLSVCFYFDLLALGNKLMDNYQDYGFVTSDTYCNSQLYLSPNCTASPVADPQCLGPSSAYMWRDEMHPAWRTDLYWAQGIYNVLARL